MNREWERMWKEVAQPYFKLQSHHFPGGTEENWKKTQDIQSLG
jgi:hypothetical protein